LKEQKKKEKVELLATSEDHEDPMRSMIAESQGKPHKSYQTLSEAIANNALVILQGDDGGQIYLTCPAIKVKCSEIGLKLLLRFLDDLGWNDLSAAAVYFEDVPENSGIPGGMGGGRGTGDIWLHPKLADFGIEKRVRSFICGLTQAP
jgi:hypothetical protein